ncbi:MAG TPA: c-type cytochrome [Planctomycetota bacterium]|nr:c-type cytochrome [Planctomycetota bacterium]HRR80778.1 c-type cytochrome [Planctomycetota bacterium]HRT97064.1 c-type cytochrome [Planctomycetota bacterium]
MTGVSRLGSAVLLGLAAAAGLGAEQRPAYQSPFAILASKDGSRLFVSHHTAGAVSAVDVAAGKVVWTAPVGGAPAGLALSPDGAVLYAADSDSGMVAAVATAKGNITGTFEAGRGVFGLALAADGSRLFACDRFLNRVNVVDVAAKKAVTALPATREPFFCALSPDGATLWAANLLPLGPATDPEAAAALDAYDTRTLKPLAHVKLPSGATDVRQIACSPDGAWVYVVHVVARFNLPPTQLERGWVNNSGLSIVDAKTRKHLATLLLDEASNGHAMPFAAVISPDAKTLAITYTGTHEVGFIDLARMHERLAKEPATRLPELVNELSLLSRWGAIRRCTSGGRGPHGAAFSPKGDTLYVANYFSDNLALVNVEKAKLAGTIALGPAVQPDLARRGEMLFFDATICYQRWQSCGTCHPDARVDGLNWDLLNDGMGNPKNNKSMLNAHRTAPMMSLGIREDMEHAVRAGLQFILYRQVIEEEATAIDAYIRSLTPRPSPHRNRDGSLTPEAKRGEAIFKSSKAACSACHTGELFTDCKTHDVGTAGPLDANVKEFDNPSLLELYRTGPYLHDGRAVTLQELLTKFNPGDRHGRTSHLSKQEIEDLVAYLLSL